MREKEEGACEITGDRESGVCGGSQCHDDRNSGRVQTETGGDPGTGQSGESGLGGAEPGSFEKQGSRYPDHVGDE